MKVAIVKGDGVGPEVMAQATKLIGALKDAFGIEISTVEFDLSADHYLTTQIAIPDGVIDELKKGFNAILLGPLGDPRIPENKHAREILVTLRREFDLYAICRTVKLLTDDLCPLSNKTSADIDFKLIWDGSEGSYSGIGGFYGKGSQDEIAVEEYISTKKDVERIIRFAFEEAGKRQRKKVTLVIDPIIMGHSYDLWLRTFREIRPDYPDIMATHLHIRAIIPQLLKTPEQFDIIVTNGLFGSTLSSLGATLQGGFGLATSAYFGSKKFSLFKPLINSFPNFSGKDYANPISSILCVQLLLKYVGKQKAANVIEKTLIKALNSDWITRDLGGSMGTSEVGDYICSALVELTG